MDKITVEQIKEHRDTIATLSDKESEARKTYNDESRRLQYDIYQERIRAIERERDEAINNLTTTHNAVIADLDSQIQEQVAVVNQAERILAFLKLGNSKDLAIPDNDIQLSQHIEQYQEALGYLCYDDYLKVKAFIIGNRKPKNKYSLIVVGKSIFPEEIIKYPYGYGMGINNWGHYFALQEVVKESASVDDLKAYYGKRKDAILKDTITEYEKVKAEYEEAKQVYTMADFAELVTWRCPKCNNFLSIFDSFANGYIPKCYNHEPDIEMVKTGVEAIR